MPFFSQSPKRVGSGERKEEQTEEQNRPSQAGPSDRDRVLNLYAIDPASNKIEQLTHHTEYDVRRPSAGGNRIVYELGGQLWVLNTHTKKTAAVQASVKKNRIDRRS